MDGVALGHQRFDQSIVFSPRERFQKWSRLGKVCRLLIAGCLMDHTSAGLVDDKRHNAAWGIKRRVGYSFDFGHDSQSGGFFYASAGSSR